MLEINSIILIIILFTSVIQSLFGVGILLFGTPILLLFDFQYLDVLNILLPISITVNFFQFNKRLSSLDKKVVSNLILLVLPIIVLSLSVAIYIDINFNRFIAIFLIFVSLYRSLKISSIASFIDTKTYLIIMGFIHGLTNLGGSLLTAYIFPKKWDKIKKRANIAFCYSIFAITQLLTLWINKSINIEKEIIIYGVIALITYTIVNRYIFIKINNSTFTNMISILLLIFGIMLLVQ